VFKRCGSRLSSWRVLDAGTKSPIGLFLRFAVVILGWVALYQFNAWLFDAFSFSQRVSWIFLPAAIRMLAVLCAGWVGALGIFAASVITATFSDAAYDVPTMFLLGALSGLSPVLALLVGAKALNIKTNLEGLKAGQLIGLSVLVAASASVLHSVGFFWVGLSVGVAENLLPMFVGDLIGTLLMLYLARLLIKLWITQHRTAAL